MVFSWGKQNNRSGASSEPGRLILFTCYYRFNTIQRVMAAMMRRAARATMTM